jgi:hypothetical protein
MGAGTDVVTATTTRRYLTSTAGVVTCSLTRKEGNEMAKTVYRIEARVGWMHVLLWELYQWGENRYTLEDGVVVTTCKNVVDVATETFIKVPHLIKITTIKGGDSHARKERGIQDHALRGI